MAKAHAALGPAEPELNGADSYGGGGPHVDDYMAIVADLGECWPLSYDHYTRLAKIGGHDRAINHKKGRVEGLPRPVYIPKR